MRPFADGTHGFPREDLARALDESGEERELLGGEVYALLPAPHHVPDGVEYYITGLDHCLSRLPMRTPRKRPHTCQ